MSVAKKQVLLMDITLMVAVAPKDDTAADTAEAIYGTNAKTFGRYESFTHIYM